MAFSRKDAGPTPSVLMVTAILWNAPSARFSIITRKCVTSEYMNDISRF